MATPLYKKLREKAYSTFTLPSVNEELSASFQNDNYKINFSKFVLLNLDLSKMDLDNKDIFNTESNKVITDKGELLVNSLRNYVANQEVVIRESKLNQNTYFYDPNQPRTVSERVFWKWLRKSGIMQFEPALPNDEYIESSEFAVDDNAPDDYFKEYLWKERTPIVYNITDIDNTDVTQSHPVTGDAMKVFKVTVGSSSNIKPADTVRIKSEGSSNIFSNTSTEELFYVSDIEVAADQEGDSKNSTIIILVPVNMEIDFYPYSVASLQLEYRRVVQYIGEISSHNNVQLANKAYTETMAYIPDHCGQTPDVLFRIVSDKNYSSGLQYPIIPSQDQPEIVGGELYDNPIMVNPDKYAGDQYAYFDMDQKYLNAAGQMDRRRGDYYGVLASNRKRTRVVQAPYVYPEFDGANLDGITLDFNTEHYSKMNLARKIKNFDDFNATSFNNEAPKDFEFNVILWFYEVDDKLNPQNGIVSNLYGMTVLNPVVDGKIETLKKLVANGKQDGLSYQFDLNLNFSINNGEQIIEKYDPEKIHSMWGFELYSEVMRRVAATNEIFLKMAGHVAAFQTDLSNLKSLIYTQTDVRDINFRIDSLYNLLNLYKTNQIVDSETIKVVTDNTSNPPRLMLQSKDSRFGAISQLPVSTLYNTQNNMVIDYKVAVPAGKDFMVNVINDDSTNIALDRDSLNIVLDKDLDYRQTCVFNVYPSKAQANKKLTISMLSGLVKDVNKTTGAPLFNKSFNLPIDLNLNPTIKEEEVKFTEGLLQRWDAIPERFYPEQILLKKVSENYFITLKLNPAIAYAFKTGDTLLLENFNIAGFGEIGGQFTITGEIENNKISFQVDLAAVSNLYDTLEVDATNPTEREVKFAMFTQPASVRVNTGYTITITRTDRVSATLNEAYLVEVKPFRKVNLK
jgi:hypothetical protein